MNKLIGARGTGKSAELMLLAEQMGIKNIACSATSFESHINLAFTLGVKINFVSYDKINELNEPYLIDDIELFLNYKYKNCKGFTLSSDD